MKYCFFIYYLFLAHYILGQPGLTISYTSPISESFNFGEGDIVEIKEDWNGFIWIATTDGLFQFDGTNAVPFTKGPADSSLLNNAINDMLLDATHKEIWIATSDGLSCLNPATGTSKHYIHRYENKNSLSDNSVRALHMDVDGQIWMNCINKGLCMYRRASDDFIRYYYDVPNIDSILNQDTRLNESYLNNFLVAENGPDSNIIWLAGYHGLTQFNRSTGKFSWEFFSQNKKTHQALSSAIYDLEFSGHNLIVTTKSKSYVYHVLHKNIQEISAPDSIQVKLGTPTYLIRNGSSMIISYTKGRILYDIDKQRIINVKIDRPQIHSRYGIQFIDSKNREWIHSSKALTLRDSTRELTHGYIPEINNSNNTEVIARGSDDQLFILTSDPSRYYLFDTKQHTWTSETMKSNEVFTPKFQWRQALQIDSTHWFLLERNGIYKLNVRTQSLIKQPWKFHSKNPLLSAMELDHENNIWIGSIQSGLYRLDLEQQTSKHYLEELNTAKQSSQYTWITALHCDREGKIWIRLGRSFGIYYPEIDSFRIFSSSENNPNTYRYVLDFAEDNEDNIWIASSHGDGVGKMNMFESHTGIQIKYGQKQGLIGDKILAMEYGPSDRIWLVTNRGISSINPSNDKIQNFAWDRGIPKTSNIIPLSDGKIATGMKQVGVNLLDTELLNINERSPMPYLSMLRAGSKVVYRSGNQTETKQLKLHSDRDYLTFVFSALGYSNPKEFAYRLEGVDEEWTFTAKSETATYSNLKPRIYRFKFKARVAGGHWSPEKNVSIEIVPKWWESTWFKIVAFWLLLLIGYLAYRWRLKGVRKTERLKSTYQQRLSEVEMQALRSQMNPHFIFNSLNSIQHFIIKNQPKEAVEYLNRFSRLVRLILSNSRSKAIPLNDELDALSLYLELENLRFKNKFDFKVNIDSSVNPYDIELPPMLLQPFVENAILHGLMHKEGQGKIDIDIRQANETLICIITDNGIGRKAASERKASSVNKRKSLGMSITQNRLDIINFNQDDKASIEIDDLEDTAGNGLGTRVTIQLPV